MAQWAFAGVPILVAVYEEIWFWPVHQDSHPRIIGPAATAHGYENAYAIAQEKAGRFNRSEFVGNARFP